MTAYFLLCREKSSSVPPMMSQVKISVDPSITGPTRFPFNSIPRSSMIMAWVGGTEEEQKQGIKSIAFKP